MEDPSGHYSQAGRTLSLIAASQRNKRHISRQKNCSKGNEGLPAINIAENINYAGDTG